MPPRREKSPGTSTASTPAIALVDEPLGQRIDIERFVGSHDPATGGERRGSGHGLHEGLDGREDDELAAQAGEQLQPRPSLGIERPGRAPTVEGGKDRGPLAGEAREIGGPDIEIARMGEGHEYDRRCSIGERRDGQRPRGAPRAVDAGTATRAQCRRDGCEACSRLEHADEFGKRGWDGIRGHADSVRVGRTTLNRGPSS